MKILLAGNMPEAKALLQALARASEHQITHCADGAYAIAELLKHGYDWAIINGRAVSGGDKDIARIIRAMGTDTGAVPPVDVPRDGSVTGPVASHACSVEWTKEGVLQLHCGLHALMKDAMAPWRPDPGCAGEILFEYHAPCVKARRRDG